MPQIKPVPGTEIGLYDISGWNRATIADGRWLNDNTIQPLEDNEWILASAINNVSAKVDQIEQRSDVADVVGTHKDLLDYSADLSERDIVKVLCDSGYNDAQVYWRVDPEGSVSGEYYDWTYVGSAANVRLTSQDGSIGISEITGGYDLSIAAKPSVMFTYSQSRTGSGPFTFNEPITSEGDAITFDSDMNTMTLSKGFYHVDLKLNVNSSEQSNRILRFYLSDTADRSTISSLNNDAVGLYEFDLSYQGCPIKYDIGYDIEITEDSKTYSVSILSPEGETIPSTVTSQISAFSIHKLTGSAGGGGGGGEYSPGWGIRINNSTISVNDQQVQRKLTAGTGIVIDEDGGISATGGGSQEVYDLSAGPGLTITRDDENKRIMISLDLTYHDLPDNP
jgi:hypothetical protein